jgi:hypothetical protein
MYDELTIYFSTLFRICASHLCFLTSSLASWPIRLVGSFQFPVTCTQLMVEPFNNNRDARNMMSMSTLGCDSFLRNSHCQQCVGGAIVHCLNQHGSSAPHRRSSPTGPPIKYFVAFNFFGLSYLFFFYYFIFISFLHFLNFKHFSKLKT